MRVLIGVRACVFLETCVIVLFRFMFNRQRSVARVEHAGRAGSARRGSVARAARRSVGAVLVDFLLPLSSPFPSLVPACRTTMGVHGLTRSHGRGNRSCRTGELVFVGVGERWRTLENARGHRFDKFFSVFACSSFPASLFFLHQQQRCDNTTARSGGKRKQRTKRKQSGRTSTSRANKVG